MRRRIRLTCGILLLALCFRLVAYAQKIEGVETVGFTVSDMQRSLNFYTRVLRFQKISDRQVSGPDFAGLKGLPSASARVVRLKLGEEEIELTQYLEPKGRPFPESARPNDGSFQHIAIIVRDMDEAYAVLRQNRVRHASSYPQRLPDWNKGAAGIRAFYFRDPDGHFLELLEFPSDKGLAKWHRAGSELFLGIDHTAIVVADTEQSLRFYRDLLGMRIAGESENYGAEQEHLNGVFGAHLRITSLRAERGPGIELLEYLAPTDGRPAPADVRANDLLHWETRVATDAGALAKLQEAGVAAASSKLHKWVGEPGAEFIVRDPGRHAIVFHSAVSN